MNSILVQPPLLKLLVWFMDSGASKHITSMKPLFKDPQPIEEGHTMACANNVIPPVKGIESIT